MAKKAFVKITSTVTAIYRFLCLFGFRIEVLPEDTGVRRNDAARNTGSVFVMKLLAKQLLG
jgi:hypothetical protein